MGGQRIRPSRLWYAVAGTTLAVAVICPIVLVVLAVVSLFEQVQQLQRVTVPGQTRVTFTEPGTYVVYLEGPGVSAESFGGAVDVLLVPIDSNVPITVSSSQNSRTTYNLAGHEGRSVGRVRIDQPGTYWLNAGVPTDPAITHVAVGRSVTLRTVLDPLPLPVVGLLVVGLLALVPAAIAVIVVTAVRRYEARRAWSRPPAGWPPAPTTMPGATMPGAK